MSPRPEIAIYTVASPFLAMPPLSAALVLRSNSRNQTLPVGKRLRHERIALKLLLVQTLLPTLQFIIVLKMHVDRPNSAGIGIPWALVLITEFILFPVNLFALVAYCRGRARVFLPLLSLFTFCVSAAIFMMTASAK